MIARLAVPLILVIAVAGATFALTSGEPDSLAYYERSMYASAEHDGKLWLLGGWTGGRPLLNDVWTFDGEWQQVASRSPWEPRTYFSAVSFKGRLCLVGGFVYHPPSNVLGDVWCSPDGTDWELLNGDPPWEDREHFGLVVFKGRMLLFGGVTYEHPVPGYHLRAFSDVWSSDNGKDWDLVTGSAPWGPRRGFGYGVLNGKLYLYGGFDSHDRRYNDVWATADGETWERVTEAAPWSPRGTFNHAVFRDRLWVFGGNVRGAVDAANDVWSSADGRTWTRHPDAPWEPRAGANPIVQTIGAERLWLIGGFNYTPSTTRYADAWTTTDGDRWQPVD